MKHSSGIEAYLELQGSGNDGIQLPELDIPEDDCLRRRCYIPAAEGTTFKVCVKPSKDFETCGATHFKIGFCYDEPPFKNCKADWSYVEGAVLGQAYSIRKVRFLGVIPSAPHLLRLKPATGTRSKVIQLHGNLRNIPSPGTIIVYVVRGTLRKLADPTAGRAVDNSDKARLEALPGLAGRPYVFEFHPRSKEDILTNVKQLSGLGHGFKATPSETTMAVSKFLSDLTPDDSATQAMQVQPWSNTTQAEEPTPNHGKATKTSLKRIHSLPRICACPESTHSRPQRSSKKASTNTTNQAGQSKSTARTKSDQAHDENDDISPKPTATETKSEQELKSTKEVQATPCGRCAGIKKAPRGKKIAWRSRIGKWMYVHKDAYEEEAPLNDGRSGQLQTTTDQQDDDEPLPQAKPEPTVESALKDNGENATVGSERHDPGEQPNVPLNVANGTAMPTAAEHQQAADASTGPSHSDTLGLANQHVSYTATESDVTIQEEQHPAGETKSDGTSTQDAIAQNLAPATPRSLIDNAETPVTSEQVEEEEVEVATNKRKNEAEHTAPVSKIQRIEVDLTEDDDDPIIIEAKTAGELNLRSEARKRADDKRRLKQVQRLLKIEQLKLEEEELEHRLSGDGVHEDDAGPIKEEPDVKMEE